MMQASPRRRHRAEMNMTPPRPIRTPSFAEAAGQDVMHRPLHNSRIVRGASFGDGSIMQVSGQKAYASHGIAGYGASSAAAACRSPQGAAASYAGSAWHEHVSPALRPES